MRRSRTIRVSRPSTDLRDRSAHGARRARRRILTRTSRGRSRGLQREPESFSRPAAQAGSTAGTTNPVIATGDGVIVSFRACAVVRDLGSCFHPDVHQRIAGAARVLIQRDRARRRRHPPGPERQAIHARVSIRRRARTARRRQPRGLRADGRHNDTASTWTSPGSRRIRTSLFRGSAASAASSGSTSHAIRAGPPGRARMVGGLRVDLDGRTSIPGLWAVGECASSGLRREPHGFELLLEASSSDCGQVGSRRAGRASTCSRWSPCGPDLARRRACA